MEYSVPITMMVLGTFVLIGILPKVPVWAKILLQLGLGGFIYKFKSDAMFLLPMASTLPMSELFGGDMGTGSFNKYALGVLGPVIGILISVIFAVVAKLLSKKESE